MRHGASPRGGCGEWLRLQCQLPLRLDMSGRSTTYQTMRHDDRSRASRVASR